MKTKLFLSALDVADWKTNIKEAKKNNCKYMLYSYNTLRKQNAKDIDALLEAGQEIMLDSGAHALQKPGVNTDWEEYVDEYIKFVNKYKNRICHIVELDIENKVGLSLVEKWRRKIINETDMEPIIVWHRERGWDYYKWMCKKYKYVGFSGFVEDNTGQKEVPDRFVRLFVDTAHSFGAKIHGFGYTRNAVSVLQFDSVDSSTWSMGVRYGTLFEFANSKMVSSTIKGWDKKAIPRIIEVNVREWVKFANYLEL